MRHLGFLTLAAALATAAPATAATGGRHVLLVSVDGLHAGDLARFVASHPDGAMAGLARRGTTFADAYAPVPSDSFPGLLALVTGGAPAVTGVWYDNSYARELAEPGSACASHGTEAVFDESVDKNPDALDGGGGIDTAKLPLDPARGCAPVYPHAYLRVNTVFEAIHAAPSLPADGKRTAWADKHLAYDLVNGPGGRGVDDLYTPEIAADGDATKSVAATEANDDLKVAAVLNEIAGKDHSGTAQVGVPVLFGMNFQAVSVAQKLKGGGYADAGGTPSAMLDEALRHADASLGRIVQALQQAGLADSTLVVLTAKHGQSPVDPTKRRLVDPKLLAETIDGVADKLALKVTADTSALVWLADPAKAEAVVKAVEAARDQLGVAAVHRGTDLGAAPGDSRAPDLLIEGVPGVIYTKPTATKLAEHGGFGEDDRHVALLVAGPVKAPGGQDAARVETTSVAPTILAFLGIDPKGLDAVRLAGTPALPVRF